MRVKLNTVGLFAAVMLVLASCSGREPRLLNAGAGADSPDEFSVLPGKPLQTPNSYSELPDPTPGGVNLTDATPRADAAGALGGNPAAYSQSGIPAADGGVLAYAMRYGVQPGVRENLAEADLAFRRRRDVIFFQRWFSRNRYFKAYRGQSLDKYKELERLRALGVLTPSAPPK